MSSGTYVLPDELELTDIVRPATAADVADVLRDATARGTPVIPVGGGTALHTGNRVDFPFLGVDLRELRGVREYEPADLTASFHAGTTIADVMETLDEHGQELPLDLPLPDQGTIGGLIATGFSGPRRAGSGTLKDLLIGCSYVRGDGLMAKAGGMLVKNVSGFEVSRLLHGSWGSLAVLTSVNLKVVPKAKADFTFSQHYPSIDDALKAQVLLLERHPQVHAAVIEQEDAGWMLRARMLGRKAALEAQVRSMRDDLGEDAVPNEDGEAWRAFNDRWASVSTDVQVTIGVKPHMVPPIARAVGSWPSWARMAISVSTGSIRVSVDPERVSREEIRSRLEQLADEGLVSWVIESAPAGWKGDTPVWASAGAALDVMQAIKQQFDPADILNRGRLFV